MTLEEFLTLPTHIADEITQAPLCPLIFKQEYLGDFDEDDKKNYALDAGNGSKYNISDNFPVVTV